MNDTETFQHYRVLRREDGTLWELGRGAMGVTYKAFDVNLRCHVALKVINGQFLDNEMARARFLREARAAAGLRHRNVASVYHLGNDEDSFFYSMEFVDGQTVESLVTERGPLPTADALQIVLQVTRALGAAAKQGVVHRDIKPANLMVVHEDDEEGGFVVKVIDFGLARSAVAGGDPSGNITMGGFVGTPQYASPEQIEEKPLDVRSDIYSLGITLWYMLAGRPPFTGTVFRISSQHLTKAPPLEDIEGNVPEPVRALLGRMLEKDPDRRPQTPAKLRTEVEACLRELSPETVDRPPTLPPIPVPGTAFPDNEAKANVTVVREVAPAVGRIFAGRYQLVKLAGEGRSGWTFRAHDGRLDGKLVAVKILRPELGFTPPVFSRLQEDLERLRDAPHPQLRETWSLERVHGYYFSVGEWIDGYPLAKVEPAGGAWPLHDALRLLGLVADAATHARTHRLQRLELDPRKILLHFPDTGEDDSPPAAASLVDRPLDRWPRFGLKLDALAPAWDAVRPSSRGSGAEGVARSPAQDVSPGSWGLVGGGYFQALNTLLCTWLRQPLPPADAATRDLAPLAALGPEVNAVLARALAAEPGFATENAFFQALLQGCGLRREDVGLGQSAADEPAPQNLQTTVRAGTDAPTCVPAAHGSPTAEARVLPVAPPPTMDRPQNAAPPPAAEALTLTPHQAQTQVARSPVPPPTVPSSVKAPPAAEAFSRATIPQKEPTPVGEPPSSVSVAMPEPATDALPTARANTVAEVPEPLPVQAEAATVVPATWPGTPAAGPRAEVGRKAASWPWWAAAAGIMAVGGVALLAWPKSKTPLPAGERPGPLPTVAASASPVMPSVAERPVISAPTPAETPAPTSAALAANQTVNPTRGAPPAESPSPALVHEEMPVAMEVVPDEAPTPPLVPTPAPAPTAASTPVAATVTASAAAPSPRRPVKAPTPAPTTKTKPPNGNVAGAVKPRATPPKPVKSSPQPPRGDDDVPAFMR